MATASAKSKSADGDTQLALVPTRARVSRATYSDLAENAWPSAITPDSVRNMLAAAARGMPRAQNEFIDNMLESDLVLAGIYRTRLFGLIGKQWEVTVEDNAKVGGRNQDSPDRKHAEEVADYCSETLAAAEGFSDTLSHLADAIGRSYAVAEIIWDSDNSGFFPVGFVPVVPNAIQGDSMHPWILRVHTAKSESPGELLSAYPHKFIVNTPNIVSHNPFRGGTLRCCAPTHLYKRLGIKWWTSYIEMFGTPYRKGTFKKNATPADKQELLDALEAFGHLGYGAFSETTDFTLLEQFRGGDSWPHPKFVEAVDKWYAIIHLGQNLTTDVSGGSFAAATVHDKVRADIALADINNEAATMRRYVLKPMTELKFGPGAPVPCWRRIIETPKDMKTTAEVLGMAVNTLGMKVTKGYAADELGIPLAKDENPDDALPGASAPASPFGVGGFLKDAPLRLTRLSDSPSPLPPDATKRTSPVRILDGWTQEIINQSGKQAKAVVKVLARGLGTIDTAKAGAETLAAKLDDLPIDNFTEIVHDYLLASMLTGAYNADKQIKQAKGRFQLADDPSFWMQPFRQAIGALRERLLLAPDDFMKLDAAARSRAGRIAGEWNLAIVKDAYASIEKQLETGGTARDFKLAIETLPDKDGWTGENPWHANVVFQQNSMMAYHSAHLQRFAGAGVEYWQFNGYDTSCPICEEVIAKTEGKAFPLSDTTYYPPIHWNCDCWAEPVLDFTPGEVITGESIDTPAYDESQLAPGAFRYNPRQFARMEPFRLGTVPEFLRSAFRDYAIANGWEISE